MRTSPTHRLCLFLPLVLAALAPAPLAGQAASTAALNGQRFINHGLVGVGRLPSNSRDKYGETIGSFSALTHDRASWQRHANGSYSGTFFMQPDRGYNNPNTTNWRARLFKLAITFSPAASAPTQNQVGITVSDTVLLTEPDGTPFTALDTAAGDAGVRAGTPPLPQAFNRRLSIDAEGIVQMPDGSFFVSDEYGPYLFRFSAEGRLLGATRPPEALIPKRNRADSFASNNPGPNQPAPSPLNPDTGRQNNQGLEGLSLAPDGKTLFALLQSSARQDGGVSGTSPLRFNTRLLAYDVTGAAPVLKGEYVLQLPTFQSGTATLVAAQSEILAINNTQLLVLARDSAAGHTYPVATSIYRKILIYDLSGATNIAGTKFDDPANPVAPNGVLDSSVRPAARTEFIDINDHAQLARFGLHNGPTDDNNNLYEKWEAMTLVPALDPAAPNDYFLFVGNDNDFITQSGFQDGIAYSHPSGMENDSMLLVYRLTLPGRVLNVSSRAQTGTGAATHLAGFFVGGPRPKQLLIRAVGPTLVNYGESGVLADPTLTIFDSAGARLAANDNWGEGAGAAEISAAAQRAGAFPLPAGSRDAAIIITLDAGAYSAQVGAVGTATGTSLIEIYELP